MKRLITLLIVTFFSCTESSFVTEKYGLKIDYSGGEFDLNENEMKDYLINSNYIEFNLPTIDSTIENVIFHSKIRIYDKYLDQEELEVMEVYYTLLDSLEKRFDILSPSMETLEYGNLYTYVVGENYYISPNKKIEYIYKFYRIKIAKHNYLIAAISTFKTDKEVDELLKKLLRSIEPK